jgi:Na+/H+ antiporter NhaD/arsenite permease-like protein
LAEIDSTMLFFGSTALTAITDNAALTCLGSLVGGNSDAAKYALVAGAMTDGRLTMIANAPNSAGFSMPKKHSMNNRSARFDYLLRPYCQPSLQHSASCCFDRDAMTLRTGTTCLH